MIERIAVLIERFPGCRTYDTPKVQITSGLEQQATPASSVLPLSTLKGISVACKPF